MTPTEAHARAKEAGNKLKDYVLTYSSAATGAFFFVLTEKELPDMSVFQRSMLGLALAFFSVTAFISLYELHIDARRFFYVAKELEKPEGERQWSLNESYKKRRLRLIFLSYGSCFLGTLAVVFFLFTRLI